MQHVARSKYSLSSRSSEESHWRPPDTSTEAIYLSVLKNIVSDTRGLNFYCRRFPQGFSSGFLTEHFLRTLELVFFNPSNSAVFSYDSRSIKSLSDDYASTSSSARTSLGSSSASASTERFRILIPQDRPQLQLQPNASGSYFLRISRNFILQKTHRFLQCSLTFWGVGIGG